MASTWDNLWTLFLPIIVLIGTAVLTRGLDRLFGVSPRSEQRHITPFLKTSRRVLPMIRGFFWVCALLLSISIVLARTDRMYLGTAALVVALPVLLAVGLALLGHLSNCLAGLIMAIDRPFQAGDRIEVDQVLGTILSLGLSQTRIHTDSGHELYVPNSRLTSGGFQTWRSVQRNIPVDVTLALPKGADLEKAKQTAYQTAAISRYASPHRRPEVFVASDQEGVHLNVRAFVCEPSLLDAYRSDIVEIWMSAEKDDSGFSGNAVPSSGPEGHLLPKEKGQKT